MQVPLKEKLSRSSSGTVKQWKKPSTNNVADRGTEEAKLSSELMERHAFLKGHTENLKKWRDKL